MTVTVIGIDGGPLPRGSEHVLGTATLVVGARRYLDAHAPEQARTCELGAFESALNALSSLTGDEHAAVLASGDPGFFGAVRALRERGIRCSVLPALSSAQRLMGRLGRSWDDVSVVSANGRDMYVCEFGRAGANYMVRVKDNISTDDELLQHLMS